MIVVLSLSLKSQVNFVPNYSFEEKDSCGDGWRAIDLLCKDWFTPMKYMDTAYNPFSGNYGSSDYYNTCNYSNYGVPDNVGGFQYAKSGNAYAGFALIFVQHPPNHPYTNLKEYIEIKLKANLAQNREYYVEFYYTVSRTDDFSYYPITLGALITDTLVKRTSIQLHNIRDINANAQIRQGLPLAMDTVSWIKVSGNFIAKGGERYITIGSFDNTDTIYKPGIYIFIDDVKLWYCGPDTSDESPVNEMIIPNIITPNGDGFNDIFKYKNQEQWQFETQVYNRWGDLIFDNKISENWDGYYKGEKVSSGVYYYIIKALAIKTGEEKFYKGNVMVIY